MVNRTCQVDAEDGLRPAQGVAPLRGCAAGATGVGHVSSFNSLRSTLPAPVAGSAAMKRTLRGAL